MSLGRTRGAALWDLWVDFHRVDAAGLTHANIRDASAGVDLAQGRFIVVGDYDADPGVAQIVEVRTDGVVLLRVLPGHADPAPPAVAAPQSLSQH